jgi:hypothetical protein
MRQVALKRHFAFLYPDDHGLQELLDLAIFVLNPAEKLSAHITVAGPFSDPKSLSPDTDFFNKICVFGVDRFRSSHQNTILLKVDADDLKQIWDKPDFPFNPHLTIYDGDDWELADRLYEALFQLRLFFCFYVSRVTHVSLVKGQGSWNLLSSVNLSLVPELKGRSAADIKELGCEERILLAVEALKRAKYRAHRLVPPGEPKRASA